MTAESRRFFSGASLAQALMTAARHFQIPADEVAYRLREKRHGFTHRQRGVVIEIDPAAPRRSTAAPVGGEAAPRTAEAERSSETRPAPRRERGRETSSEAEPRRERRAALPRQGEAATIDHPTAEHGTQAAAAVAEIIRVLGVAVETRGEVASDRLLVDLVGQDAPWIAAQGTDLLEAIEHLARKILLVETGARLHCEVDCLAIREERAGELQSLARAAAVAVRKTGRSILLDPLSAAERRLIHQALAESADLETASLGEGAARAVEVRPKRQD